MAKSAREFTVDHDFAGMASDPANGGPPPSTLAAQLVQSISTSTRSSRSDESAELKGLFAVIQGVKDDPDLLKSTAERIEHNHMLIYVYCRVALDAINLDDPFLDRAHVRAETLKTINFLRFTIKETPSVLNYQSNSHGLLLRGEEPLWLWLLPQLLRILGHPLCNDLEGSIEGFLQYLLLVIVRYGMLWELTSSVGLFLRSILTALVDGLQDPSLSPSRSNVRTAIVLPPAYALDQILGNNLPGQRLSYTILSASHALRQAASLARILASPALSQDSAFSFVTSLSENGPWLLDALLDLRNAQVRWDVVFRSSPVSLLGMTLELVNSTTDDAAAGFLYNQKAHTLVVLLCSEMVSRPEDLVLADSTGVEARLTCCVALIAIAKASLKHRAIGRLAASKLVEELTLLFSQHPDVGEQTDIWRCTNLLRQAIEMSPSQTFDESIHPTNFQDEQIRKAVDELQLSHLQLYTGGPAKRRKVSKPDVDPSFQITRQIYEALQLSNGDDDVVSFEHLFIDGFPQASEQGQIVAIDLLSRLCCVADAVNDQSRPNHSPSGGTCPVCDGNTRTRQTPSSDRGKAEVRLIFSKLVALKPFIEARRPRIAAMIALRRLVLHSNQPDFLNLETSGLGQWCLQSLNSSMRELRIAAGRTLATFLLEDSGDHADIELICRNRTNSISLLKSMSERDQPHLAESCILAWGQLGKVVDEAELNLVLIKLLEYLGSSNSIVSAFAFNELLALAQARGLSPRRLLEPFWRNLAYLATKDMVHRPQRSRAIAELLQVTVNELLLLIQTHALPWLVLDRRKDVIQKIAEARGETELWNPLMDSSNLAAVLALLLAQETDNIEEFVKSRLDEISSHFHSIQLEVLIQSEPVLIALELLKAAGDADATRQAQIEEALHTMATLVLPSNKSARQKKANVTGNFLRSYVLGLMARLTDVLNDTNTSSPPILEQRRSIRALEQMIKICGAYSRIARPQISACLMAAMAQDSLREAAFSCWAAMLNYLEAEDVEALLETTWFIVGHYWTSLNPATATVAARIPVFVHDRYPMMVQDHVSKLPSLPSAEAFDKLRQRLHAMRPKLVVEEALAVFSERICHDNPGVVHQALTELVPYLNSNQSALYSSAVSQRPDTAISALLRALLDCACKYSNAQTDVARLCTECVGLIGCLDSNQIEAVRDQRSIIVLTNFQEPEEMTDFALFLLEEVLVPSFLSATDTRLQGFLSYAMQELLDRCDIKAACTNQTTGVLSGNHIYRKWVALPEHVREVATPFLGSRYLVAPMPPVPVEYPLFRPGKPYGNWLRSFVVSLLRKGQNPHADMIFEPLTRVVRIKDLATSEFLLPYLVVHILLGPRSGETERDQVLGELIGILQHKPPEDASYHEKEDAKRFFSAVFRVVDYSMRWIQAKRSAGRLSTPDKEGVARIQGALDAIPAELIAQRAIDCDEYARALFHLEQHAQKLEHQKREAEDKKRDPGDRDRLLERLQDIYANIDEPDGLEGISAQLHELDINQQILSHKKAGRWTAAQTWYEMQLAEKPDSVDAQVDLLHCLKQAGQHDVLLNHVEGLRTDLTSDNKIMPFAVEAAWVTGRWESLVKFRNRFHGNITQDFNISIAALLESLSEHDTFAKRLRDTREKIAFSMSNSATASLQAAHDIMLKCHVLTDLEIIVSAKPENEEARRATMTLLDGRLEVIGAYFNDKQYLLGIRRAAMELTRPTFSDLDISGLWLSSARLARKADSLHQSFNAVLHATQLGDDAAAIENAKLLWRENHHRKAIQTLQGAIDRNKFMTQTGTSTATVNNSKLNPHQKLLTARAQLLLAKWLDTAGQTHTLALREKYQQPPKTFSGWEKGHYYLGRYYKKILEAEKLLKPDDQSDNYVIGEIARLVIENYVRSLNSGTKYIYQTLPRILTLWLDLGAQVDRTPDGKASLSRELHKKRVDQLNLLHSVLDKYIYRLPAYIFYTALPQIVARIAHHNTSVFERLSSIIFKVVEVHPRQALWSLIGIMTSKQVSERKVRGSQILQTLRSITRKVDGNQDLKQLLRAGEKLADQLLQACQNGDFPGNKSVHASLTRDLRFNHKCTPCPLVVPVETTLIATLPAVSEHSKKHKAFSRDVVTIDSFLDDVLVLSSLAKPRRLTARGSDGKNYMLLIKPKDDLRTDQRLMEFNGMINRSLKRDAESSRRQLYIRTYAVVPLNEECGIIEWVPGIKTMRDILLALYASQKIHPDYQMLRQLMDDASSSESRIRIFTEDVLGRFPPVLHLWFIQQFPNPSAWFAARIKYTRSCAVMSMVGTILGLGDRHGENVNLEEGNGGVFHVDFNCLFDKGQTFAKPERVPFRLTHNMVTAMGIYGYEGPFRKSSELTLSILRQQEETLMTILESFIYDPTLDLQKDKRARKGDAGGVKLHPQSVVDSIKRKVKGLLPHESIPLSVEGQVEELIKQAIDPRNLTAMYIGWCPFL